MLQARSLPEYANVVLVPIPAIIEVKKIGDSATDYSINNTARHLIWLPVSSETKFNGKPTVDTLFARIGDLLAALTVLVGVQLLQLPTQGFLVFTLALVVAWLVVGWDLVRQHRHLTLAKTGGGLK